MATQYAKAKAKVKTVKAKVQVTVGDLIAATFDIMGNRVDRVVELLTYDGLKNRAHVVVEGRLPRSYPR